MGPGSEDDWEAFLERSLGREFPTWWGRSGEDPGAGVELKLSGSCEGEMWQLRGNLCFGPTLGIIGLEGLSQIRGLNLPCPSGKW